MLRVNPADGAQTVALVMPEVHQSVTQDGLLGLALHPRPPHGPADAVFVAFTYDDAPRAGVRPAHGGAALHLTTRPVAASASPADVLTGLPVHDDHLAGRLAFGPDGLLYLSLGDEGSNFGGNRCQLESRARSADRGRGRRPELDVVPGQDPAPRARRVDSA